LSIPQKELGPNDWYRVYSSPKIDHCSDMILDPANNLYLTGYAFFPRNPLDYDLN